MKGFQLKKGALVFALRYGVIAFCGSLFTFARPVGDPLLPDATWILVSVAMTSFFPSLEAGPIYEKTLQRVAGTCTGCAFGMAVGFLSTLLPSGKGMFLATMVFLGHFASSFIFMQWKHKFGKYLYSFMLLCMTYDLVILSFYSAVDGPLWVFGAYRVLDICIGALLSFLGAILLWPTPTADVLVDQLHEQFKLTGSACKSILGDALKRGVDKEHHSLFPVSDERKSLLQAIGSRQTVRDKIELLKVDPFHRLGKLFSLGSIDGMDCITDLARLFRAQTTLLLLESVIRNEDLHLTETQREAYARIGSLLDILLQDSFTMMKNRAQSSKGKAEKDSFDDVELELEMKHQRVVEADHPAADELMLMLEQVHLDRVAFSTATLPNPASSFDRKSFGGAKPVCALNGESSQLLFSVLVEHLICRVLRIHSIEVSKSFNCL